jgi:uncharacterized protein with PQ loop repeat
MPEVNNKKKRFGRRAAFGVVSLILTTVAFYVCMIVFAKSKAELGLNWWLMYALFTFGISGLASGLLTITDVKALLPFKK